MGWTRVWGVSAVLCVFSQFAATAAKWDDTKAPITVIEPEGILDDTINYHMAHFGAVPYGTLIDGCVPCINTQVCLSSPLNTHCSRASTHCCVYTTHILGSLRAPELFQGSRRLLQPHWYRDDASVWCHSPSRRQLTYSKRNLHNNFTFSTSRCNPCGIRSLQPTEQCCQAVHTYPISARICVQLPCLLLHSIELDIRIVSKERVYPGVLSHEFVPCSCPLLRCASTAISRVPFRREAWSNLIYLLSLLSAFVCGFLANLPCCISLHHSRPRLGLSTHVGQPST